MPWQCAPIICVHLFPGNSIHATTCLCVLTLVTWTNLWFSSLVGGLAYYKFVLKIFCLMNCMHSAAFSMITVENIMTLLQRLSVCWSWQFISQVKLMPGHTHLGRLQCITYKMHICAHWLLVSDQLVQIFYFKWDSSKSPHLHFTHAVSGCQLPCDDSGDSLIHLAL